jgi:hypothetical protein
MTADVADIPSSDQNVELAPEPGAAFLLLQDCAAR